MSEESAHLGNVMPVAQPLCSSSGWVDTRGAGGITIFLLTNSKAVLLEDGAQKFYALLGCCWLSVNVINAKRDRCLAGSDG